MHTGGGLSEGLLPALSTDTATPSIKLPMVIRPRSIYTIRNLTPLSGPRPSNRNRRPPAMTYSVVFMRNGG